MRWQPAVIGGVLLGILVAIWQVIAAQAGLNAIFPLVATALELAVLLPALYLTRKDHGYALQVASGSALAGVSLVFIVPGAVLVGASGADMAAGAFGTLITGVVVSALAAIGLRRPTLASEG